MDLSLQSYNRSASYSITQQNGRDQHNLLDILALSSNPLPFHPTPAEVRIGDITLPESCLNSHLSRNLA